MRLRNLVLLFYLATQLSVEASKARVFGHKNKSITKQTSRLFDKKPTIRVRVKKSLKDVIISGTDIKRKFHSNQKLNLFRGRKAVRFKCHNLSKRRRRFERPVLLASLGSSTGLISLEKNKYKGLLHVVTSSSNDSCDVVHETDIEHYLSSLLAREMNSKWPIEALKAQAIAARSYAIHKLKSQQVKKIAGHETFYDIESSEKHQVSGDFFDTSRKTRLATLDTKGIVLTDSDGKLSPIFFHAKCGGKTLRPEQVWQNRRKSYRSVKCPFCKGHGSQSYDKALTIARWTKFLKWAHRKAFLPPSIEKDFHRDLKVVPNKMFTRKIKFYMGENLYILKKTLLRRYFGRVIVPSNNFSLILNKKGSHIRLKGEGLGHGVGLCQLGALDLAQKGWNFKKILAYYFPKHKMTQLY